MKKISLGELHGALLLQAVDPEDFAFICPMCGCVQSARDLIAAGAGENLDAVEKYLGFSCVGRFTGAASPRKEHDGNPCNWTLGGLFRFHRLEVEFDDGATRPIFELASREQAQAHAASKESH